LYVISYIVWLSAVIRLVPKQISNRSGVALSAASSLFYLR